MFTVDVKQQHNNTSDLLVLSVVRFNEVVFGGFEESFSTYTVKCAIDFCSTSEDLLFLFLKKCFFFFWFFFSLPFLPE